MTLAKALQSKLAEHPSSTPLQVQVSEGPWTATVDARSGDAHSVLADEIRLERSAPADGSVQRWAASIASRVTGLLEPLKVLEVDAATERAVLRSATPSSKDGEPVYYEMNLAATSKATLNRYQGTYEAGKKRQPIPFALTHEAIEKLVNDCTS
jgi:hypothetical protein